MASMVAKLLYLLNFLKPKPQAIFRGWQMKLCFYHVSYLGEQITVWWLLRPNGKGHALIGQRTDKLNQFYDWGELGPRRN